MLHPPGSPPIRWTALAPLVLLLAGPGCATMRWNAPDPDLRPCGEAYVYTADGWKLGIRHISPRTPDPNKLPVILCHGLGLNGTFWTITPDHMAQQLADRGYEVFIPDMRGSGASLRTGRVGRINSFLRQTPFNEIGDGNWTVDDQVRYDVPAILNYVIQATGKPRVNWVGHSLGGMLMYAYLEVSPNAWRIANFVGMGSTIVQAEIPQTDMLESSRMLRVLLKVASPGRLGRPMMYGRPPGLAKIDRFYYTADCVDKETVDRFYGYTLENPGAGALRQLDPYLEFGHFVSADRRYDYARLLPRITTPHLMIAGDGDIMSDVPSSYLTFQALSSADKTFLRFGRNEGHMDDYGHCDLVWSRNAPKEIFPIVIDWLDNRQPGAAPSLQAEPPPPTSKKPLDSPLPEALSSLHAPPHPPR